MKLPLSSLRHDYVPIDGDDVDDDEIEAGGVRAPATLGITTKAGTNVVTLSLALLCVSALLFIMLAMKTATSPSAADLHEKTTQPKTIPFRQIDHPEPPSFLWGTVSKPYPTGAFWTNFAVQSGDHPVGVYPYGVKALETGIQVSYGASHRRVTPARIADNFNVDLQISATQPYFSRGVESYDNVSVAMAYKVGGGGKYKAFLVKATPYVTVLFENATPVISAPQALILSATCLFPARNSSGESSTASGGTDCGGSLGDETAAVPGSAFLVVLGNYQKWLVYCSDTSLPLILKDGALTTSAAVKSAVIRVAVLPPQRADEALSTLITYLPRYPTGGQVTLSYQTTTAVVSIHYQSAGDLSSPLLMLALPHHLPLLPDSILQSDATQQVSATYSPIWCIKGRLTPVVGEDWKLTYRLPAVSWHYNLLGQLSTSQMDVIAKNLLEEVRTLTPQSPDSYSFGKELGRMSRLALLADYLGISDARQQALSTLELALISWLQGLNVDALVYDRTYGGLVTTKGLSDFTADFGVGMYSDHHFHFGYFLNALAVVGKLDPQFLVAHRSAADAILRDICNPDATDADFPFVRHKDWFDGHSWASGLFPQNNGKGQESSSEAINAYYGAFLYSLVTTQVDLLHTSSLALAMEIQAVQVYWHMSDDLGEKGAKGIYDAVFAAKRMVGNIGALDVTTDTWFSGDIEAVHGINMLPLSPVTAVLFDAAYAAKEYPAVSAYIPPAVVSSTQQMCSANASKYQGEKDTVALDVRTACISDA